MEIEVIENGEIKTEKGVSIAIMESPNDEIYDFHIDNREKSSNKTHKLANRTKSDEKKRILRFKNVFFKTIKKYNSEDFTFFNVSFSGSFSFSDKNGEIIEEISHEGYELKKVSEFIFNN